MPKNTKKAERAALHKERRRVRRLHKAHQKSKRSGPAREVGSHPHRRTATMRARKRG